MRHFHRLRVLRLRVAGLLVLGTAFGSLPALAQVDFSGEWAPRFYEDQPERVPGPELGDYLGLPINAAGRMRADTWDAEVMTLPEWQCRPHSADYIWRGPSNLRISKEVDPVSREIVAWHAEWLRSIDRAIYMDGRPHPPDYALHSWAGFSTGKWEGDILTTHVTHLKEGYIRRNGMARSDQATLTEHWIRHGDWLTVVTIVNDPVYLTEPFIRTTDYELDVHQMIPPYPCEMVNEVERAKGIVPNHLPGTNPFLKEFPERFHIPELATRGGAETMYPEYALKMKGASVTPPLSHNRAPRDTNQLAGEIQVLPVRDDIYMLLGAGGNITLKIAKNGVVLLVNSGLKQMSDQVLATVRKMTSKPIRVLINTDVHAENTGGNEKIAASGNTLTGGNVAGDFADSGVGATIIAHENVLNRMSAPRAGEGPLPAHAMPEVTYHIDSMKLSATFNGERMEVFHLPAAHTDGDSMVWFRDSDVLSTGDVFNVTGYPMIDLEKGGSIQGEIDALNRILDLAIPEFRLEGGTLVIPGRGRLCDVADVAYYRDMVTVIRDRIQDMVKKGMTLAQVKAARPTLDYDGRYGSDTGPWTTDMFIEAVYRSLSGNK
jgi:glyoxylase-like metal-dependent hydrolase (beta-lactamase superfamily II)